MGSNTDNATYGEYTYANLEREPYWPTEKLKISITGAGGFIASHIARRLKNEGHYIIASDWKKNEHMPEDMFCHEFHLADLRVMDNCLKITNGVDHVFNLAADMGGMGFIQSNHSVIMYNNTMISFNALEASRINGQFVKFGSVSTVPNINTIHLILLTLKMAFSTNPLSLNVPDPTFESWLRDSGYLEILDSRSSSATCQPPTAVKKPLTNTTKQREPTKTLFLSILSFWKVLFCLVTINPFAKLTSDDLAGKTPSWTVGFIGRLDSYSWPAGPGQARMRVQENVRRYVKNYAWLGLLFLACSLYQMPVPLLGAVSSLLLWEGVRFFSEKWELGEKHPGIWQVLVRLVQCATAAILYACNIQLAFFCAISVSYTVMILHASLRKLAPPKLSSSGRIKRLQPR